MPVFNRLAKIVGKPIPRVITPRIHSMVDYISVAVFLASAARFWRRNKRAAMGSLICGGAELAVVLLTDYPGGVKKFISFRMHREMDYGLAAMAATMPESLGFKEDDETKFCRLQGAMITLLGEVTQTSAIPANRSRGRAA
ncbi:MAG: hypothetical protein JWQ87_3274 [Candidatus Sulfotelmatobacter sp.]|nr:hypothetical protein [Candidatus Sulfotelmatobacter sp.]